VKTKTIKLRYVGPSLTNKADEERFEVITITNSTRYLPGEILLAGQVEDLCRANGWTCTLSGVV
jgi:hypothetical protein